MVAESGQDSACYDKALRLLAARAHFVRQMEEKLSQRGFAPDVVERVLERLVAADMLDDRRVADEFIRSRLRRGPMGRRRMWQELRRRGADESMAEEALEEAFAGIDEGEAARQAAEQWSRRGRRDAAALARHLDRKGFPAGAILRAVEERQARWDDESD